MFKKTIISEFFTTVSFSQAMQSLYLMTFWFFKLRYWEDRELFEKELLNYLIGDCRGKSCVYPKIVSFYNWRSAIFHALKMIWVEWRDEVIVNAYNCISVSNAVIQAWAKIIYSDIESKTLSFDFKKLEKNINSNTKLIILQHTFWKQARDYKKIIDLAKKKWILILEDCAHSLWNNAEILWDFAIFSTWRDKVISSVTWWFLLINNSKYFDKIAELRTFLKMPSIKLIMQNLIYNIVWFRAYFYYDFLKLGKLTIFLSRKLNLITEILSSKEKSCSFKDFYFDFPNSLAYLARKELKKINEYKKIRLKNSEYYLKNIKNNNIKYLISNFENYNWFRFPIILNSEKDKDLFYSYMRWEKILLWNYWSWQSIIPIWTDLKIARYKLWTCPVAEDISKRILTLPNHKIVKYNDLNRVVDLLNKFKKK